MAHFVRIIVLALALVGLSSAALMAKSSAPMCNKRAAFVQTLESTVIPTVLEEAENTQGHSICCRDVAIVPRFDVPDMPSSQMKRSFAQTYPRRGFLRDTELPPPRGA
jgi:hypothetical protein